MEYKITVVMLSPKNENDRYDRPEVYTQIVEDLNVKALATYINSMEPLPKETQA